MLLRPLRVHRNVSVGARPGARLRGRPRASPSARRPRRRGGDGRRGRAPRRGRRAGGLPDRSVMLLDLKLASRRLLATPIFSVFAVMSLAVGIGVTTAIYSVIDAVFLRDAGIRDPDRVAIVASPRDGVIASAAIS